MHFIVTKLVVSQAGWLGCCHAVLLGAAFEHCPTPTLVFCEKYGPFQPQALNTTSGS